MFFLLNKNLDRKIELYMGSAPTISLAYTAIAPKIPAQKTETKEAKETGSVANSCIDNPDPHCSYRLFDKENFIDYGGVLLKEKYAAYPEEYAELLFLDPGSKDFVIDLEDPSFEAFIDYVGYDKKLLPFRSVQAFTETVSSTSPSRYSIVDSDEVPFIKPVNDKCLENEECLKSLEYLAKGPSLERDERSIGITYPQYVTKTSDVKVNSPLKQTNRNIASRGRA